MKKAAILATAAASADAWATIGDALTANGTATTALSDAVAAAHSHSARELAARRLIANRTQVRHDVTNPNPNPNPSANPNPNPNPSPSANPNPKSNSNLNANPNPNHAQVLHDVTNPARWTNVEGRPLTQLELRRVHPDLAPHVDRCLQETARRLLSHRLEWRPPHAGAAARSEVVAAAWAATARYLDGRIQGRPEQKPGRTPDMDADAAAAMRAVLQAVGGQGH